MIELLIADDHTLFVDGLVALFSKDPEINVTSIARTGEEVLEQVKKSTFDVILLDLFMPEMDGMECTRKLMDSHPNQKIIVLTMSNEASVIKKMMVMNIKGYVLKSAKKKELIQAIKQVHKGKKYFSSQITNLPQTKAQVKVGHSTFQRASHSLTDREIEIIQFIAEGLSSQEIGEKLFISPRTIETHRSNIIKKLKVKNVASLVSYAYKHNILN